MYNSKLLGLGISRAVKLNESEDQSHAYIDKAWGVLWSLNKKEEKHFLVRRCMMFGWDVESSSVTCSDEAFERGSNNIKFFEIRKKLFRLNNINVILVDPKLSDGIVLDGELIKTSKSIPDGKCKISIPNHSLNFEFEAFFDVSENALLKPLVNKGQANNYRVTGVLGQGGYGTVYKCLWSERKEFYALKAEHVNEGSHIVREYELMKSCRHENIAKVIEFIVIENNRYLLTEYAEGGDLHQRIEKENGINETSASYIFKQVCSAISYLHNRKIVHRDIKPKNIVLMNSNEFCRVKLIDFGLACFIDSEEMNGVAGETRFFPPEMLIEYVYKDYTAVYDDKIDIWSLGVTIFFSLTRTYPFNYTTFLQLYVKRVVENEINTNIDEYTRLSSEVKELVCSCLQIKAKDRPPIDVVLLNKWLHTDAVITDEVHLTGTLDTEAAGPSKPNGTVDE